MRNLSFFLLLALLLSSCSAFSEAPAGPVSFMVSGDPAELQAYQTLVEAYEAKNPGEKVELIHIPSQGDYRTRLAADFAAGTPSDVVLINYRRLGPFASRGALEPLGPYLADSKVIAAADFYPEALEPFQWQGVLQCIPQNLSSLAVYYNKKLFDEAGVPYPGDDWSWDDLLAAAKALTKDLDGDGRSDQHGLGFTVELARFAPFIWQNGGEVVNSQVAPTRLLLDMPQSIDAVAWVTALQTEHHVTPDAVEEASEDSESRFMNGRLGMYLNSRRGVPAYREIEGFDWDVAPLPQGQHIASLVHSDAYCMPATVKDKDRVWKFIEFANSPEGQQIIAATGRTVPSLKAVAQSPAFLDPGQKPANSQAFLDMIPYLRSFPNTAAWTDVEEAVTEELKRGFYGQVTVDEAIKNAVLIAQQYLSENVTP